MADTDSNIKTLPKEELDDQLEDALEQTFPASDPVAVGEPTAEEAERPIDRLPAQIDKSLVDELARQVAERRRQSRRI